MANRYLKKPMGALEQDVVTIYGTVTFGATSTVTAYKGGGIATVAGSATGRFLITLQDSFHKVLSFKASVMNFKTAGPAAPIIVGYGTAAEELAAIKTKTFLFSTLNGSFAETAPGTGTIIKFELVVRNSYIGPWD